MTEIAKPRLSSKHMAQKNNNQFDRIENKHGKNTG